MIAPLVASRSIEATTTTSLRLPPRSTVRSDFLRDLFFDIASPIEPIRLPCQAVNASILLLE
jgi:hypothetical protein